MSISMNYCRYFLSSRNAKLFSQYGKNAFKIQYQSFKSSTKVEKPTSRLKIFGLASIIGVSIGTYYAYYNKNVDASRIAILNPSTGEKSVIIKELPKLDISRTVTYPNDDSGLEFLLLQYPTCPFCCKVRAFLDFYGLSYNVIEVNPVLRQQLKWTDYKKVPILLVKVNGGYIQLNDSSMIISALTSYIHDKNIGFKEIADFYPSVSYMDNDGLVKKEILNRYFIMYQGAIPVDSSKESIAEERKWRQWADDVLVHTLSPNVYRTRDEALQAFKWFSEVGQWKHLFSAWEEQLVVYVGAFAMWMIGKRLKKKYHLKDDVRQSLYDECNIWLREIRSKGTTFHGGVKPDLADLAVYGVLSSIEGCTAFSDLLQHTKLNEWYFEMKNLIKSQQVQVL